MANEKLALWEREFLRFADLKAAGICDDRATLRRWQQEQAFPLAYVMSANSIAWSASEIRDWLSKRPRGKAPQPQRRARETKKEL